MLLNYENIKNNKSELEAKGYHLPKFDIEKTIKNTKENPKWIHFGAGNIFRGYVADLCQDLLNKNLEDAGIVVVETFDYEIIEKAYKPFDNLTLVALMKSNGDLVKKIVASVNESLRGDVCSEDYNTLKEMFKKDSLQMVSFTITEKGYATKNIDGSLLPIIENDVKGNLNEVKHAISFLVSLLYERFKDGAKKIALVSLDNCSSNGAKLKEAVLTIANVFVENGKLEKEFLAYLEDETKVSFPWSMIDKITPRPSEIVEEKLKNDGFENISPIKTNKNTFIAPFINAEIPQYLVMEDSFPNGRPCLEEAGVYLTTRETVNKTETMKVTTCLNPLHTALAVYGCLLGYTSIAEEMKDKELVKLITKMGYEEGMPVVVDPKILDPKAFIKEVIEERFPNPFIPDAPQRIATDTSQKVGIRYGETIKSYIKSDNLDVKNLVYIPLVLAGWLRYLLGVDDKGNTFERSSDPMLEELSKILDGIKLGDKSSYNDNLKQLLTNDKLFGVNLIEIGLGDKIEEMFLKMISGVDAVRNTLKEYLE